jgi:hypothetical protein
MSPELAKLPGRLTVRQVAEYLNMGITAILNFRDDESLEFINIAPRGSLRCSWRITRSSLALFEQRRKTSAKP